MDRTNARKNEETLGTAGDALQRAVERTALLEQVCRTVVLSHYEECNLIDAVSRSVHTLLENGASGTGRFLSACAEDYDAGLDRMMEDCAFDAEDREALRALQLNSLLPRLRKGEQVSVCLRLRGEDGGPAWKRVECSFFREEEKQILMLVADIQEEENTKQRLRDAAEAAEAASRAKSAFLANMSHEIRTPMNAIVGISEVLLRRELPQDVLEALSTIQNSGSSLLGIINDILDFSKIETGKFEIAEVEYMLPSILMDLSNVISVRLASKPVCFLMDIDPTLPNHFIGDDIRLKQILMNLLGNAVKFTHEGYIVLRVRGEFTEGENFELRFEVEDSGIGIRQEDLGKLFDTFSQVDTRKNHGITGSGLGLVISRDLARLMGGDLTLSSVYGQGSVFSVRVMQRVPRYVPLGEVKDKTARLLICEQNESIIRGLSAAAENLGLSYEVCREIDKIREHPGMTHVLIRRRFFAPVQEKLNFMFRRSGIFLILDNDELPDSAYMDYKQLQLPLITLQLINALNGEEIVSSIKKESFDRSQIVPLTFARILIVDDNTTNLQVAQGLMSPYQMKIDLTTSGFEAIEMVKKTRYDAIFMDHMMPEMDGIETAHYIRSMEGDYFREVPIIALTANAMSDAREQFLQAGMNDFVAKPIEMRELHRVIKQYIQSRAPKDYLEKVKKERESAADRKNAVTPTPGKGERPVGALKLRQSAEAAPGALGQLLAQNNALLEQNMLLLRALLGEAPAETENPAQAAAEAIREPERASEAAPAELPDFIPGVDMHRILETYGGSVEIYHNILKTYYDDIREKEETLPVLFDRQDTENFTIQVHALKSASRGVGAFDLGEASYRLELAGKAGDWNTIKTLFPEFREALHRMVENVGRYAQKYLLPQEDSGGEFQEHPDPALIDRLREACAQMDYLRAEEILKSLRKYSYPEPFSRRLDELCACCAAFDYDRLDSLVTDL